MASARPRGVEARPGPGAAPRRSGDARLAALIICTLAGFAVIAYGSSLRLPFLADDYLFLDRTRWARVQALVSFAHVDFRGYRPWSREIHFWALQSLFGSNPVPFRVAGALLWIAALALYWRIVRFVAGPRAACVATFGVATLALWGTPLLWISGSQDLWMLVLSLLALWLCLRGHDGPATLPFALALLSKETAVAFLPVILTAHVLLRGESLARAARRMGSLFAVAAIWALIHPTLRQVLVSSRSSLETASRPAFLALSLRTLGSVANLSMVPDAGEMSGGDV